MGSDSKRTHYTSASHSSSQNVQSHSSYSPDNSGMYMSYTPASQEMYSSAGPHPSSFSPVSNDYGMSTYSLSSNQYHHSEPSYGMMPSSPAPLNSMHYSQSSGFGPSSGYSQHPYTPNSLDEYIMAVGGPPPPTSPMIPYNYGSLPLPHNQSGGYNDYSHYQSSSHQQSLSNTQVQNTFDASLLSGIKQCSHCGTRSTPLWRRDPKTHEPLCNACGVYVQQRGEQRPQQLIDADLADAEDEGSALRGGEGPECSHCHARETSVWRRDPQGSQVCNACGVYERLKGVKRPLDKVKSGKKVRPRTRT
ncbi:GATA zinc finger domain-containing protein [Favolaschia claudopus]|uniref:GATA zinc finger domain-containing protein n=1 Tax=Favolaschia claudopus TaxID=2862362 RepID=A0AAW0EEW8_9AGAR